MKFFRKLMSYTLIGAVTFNQFSTLALAATNEIANAPGESVITEKPSFISKGNIEVETHLVLPIRNKEIADINFKITDSNNNSATVALKDILDYNDGYLNKNVVLGDQDIKISATKRDKDGHILSGIDYNNNIVYFAINIYDLIKGTYKIELSGKNFVTYTKDITLEDFSQRITVTNEKGMFEIGDLNQDNVVDNKDVQIIFKAIEENDLEKDLNLDGVVDIADLNYATAIINGEKQEAKISDTDAILNSENISVTTKATLAENSDSLDTLFTDNGVVSLKQDGDTPIELALDIAGKDESEPVKMSEIRISFGDNIPEEGKIVVETEDGEKIEKDIPKSNEIKDIHLFTDEVSENTRKIDLGKQVAVKKVIITITDAGSEKLADIAKVEFLNNVKVQTKEPDNFYTPRNIQVDTKVSEQLTVSFESVPNVTGYEIKINGAKMNNVVFQTTFTSFTIEDLKNYETYEIYVRSVNQEWRSAWSDKVNATPEATRRPPAVDMVKATPTISGIDFSWNDMDDTKTYNVYYREFGTSEWLSIKNILGNKYTLKGLKPSTTYEAYITGNNDLGEGSASKIVEAKTLEQTATIYPKYKLINQFDPEIGRTTHIDDVIESIGTSYLEDIDHNFNVTDNKWSMVDDDYLSYWQYNGWQLSTHYFNINAPIFVLDNTYKMDEFVITVPDNYRYSYKSTNNNDALVNYWVGDEVRTDKNKITVQGKIIVKTDENNRKYYVLKLNQPIETNALQIGVTIGNNSGNIQIAEVKFYEYDSLVDDVAALFKDDLRVELADGVNQARINELRNRANTKNNDEYNPYRESILNDLEYAEKILNDEDLNDVITLNPEISNSYSNLGFAMTISDYQPLGVAVTEGEQLTVYVGSEGNVNAQLIFTQAHAEAGSWNYAVNLTKGQNVITVPKIGSAASEAGGSVYIRYTSLPDKNKPIKVRVSGGEKIPMLDLTTASDKQEAIKNYINELSNYVANINTLYDEHYKDKEKTYAYDKNESALGVTEIVTEYGLWSFSAEAVLDAINSGLTTEDEKINRLSESTEAFDEMMLLFYRHKGLEKNADDSSNEIPKARINIRYMTMFDGAFMYAGGYHIGIEYGSIAGVIQGKKSDKLSGYFGWGISHEIGHQINQKNIVHAEVTNNVYALLAQTANDVELSRLEINNIYEKIYDKVTSHTLGKSQNVFVTLGMYWQLHLAYDNNKTFDDTDSIFARINKESRNYKNTNNYSKDDLLILFASKASGKNLTKYFETWGLVASEGVKEELSSLPEETNAIYYLNDSARRYRLENGTGFATDTKVNASITNKDDKNKRVTISFNLTNSLDDDKLLGYEILRNGESIAFVTDADEYTDIIGSVNNRAFTYEVVAYDKLLNKTEVFSLPEVKVSHDGSVRKDTFTIESNFKGINEKVDLENDEMDYRLLSVNNLIDDNNNTYFNGVERITNLISGEKPTLSEDTSDAYVIINLNSKLSLSGIEYTAYSDGTSLDKNTIRKYKISVSSDKVNWTVVRTGSFDTITNDNLTEKVYFQGQNKDSQTQLWTYYDISYIKIESIGNKSGISGAEFNIIAPPGDNVDFVMNGEEPSIGILKEDYCYLTNTEECTAENGIIKAGSVIFEGTYAGNPAFNIVTINDAITDKKYSGEQLIFAEINSDLTVYDVTTSTWLYIMTREQYEDLLKDTHSVRATLYRVSDAEALYGERITSTSKAVNLKDYNDLSYIEITSKK